MRVLSYITIMANTKEKEGNKGILLGRLPGVKRQRNKKAHAKRSARRVNYADLSDSDDESMEEEDRNNVARMPSQDSSDDVNVSRMPDNNDTIVREDLGANGTGDGDNRESDALSVLGEKPSGSFQGAQADMIRLAKHLQSRVDERATSLQQEVIKWKETSESQTEELESLRGAAQQSNESTRQLWVTSD
jgi:hypothetical protein